MTCCLLTQNQIRYKSCLSTDCFAVFEESEAIWIWWIISRGYFVCNSKCRRRRPFIIYLIVFFIIVWIFSNVIIKIREACLCFSDNKEIWWIHILHCFSFFNSYYYFEWLWTTDFFAQESRLIVAVLKYKEWIKTCISVLQCFMFKNYYADKLKSGNPRSLFWTSVTRFWLDGN